MSPALRWRLRLDGPADGALNMARDETLLVSAAGGSPPTLRLYGWVPPALSLGAHQPASDADPRACRELGIDLVRRPTGGGAVLHELEATYAVAGRFGDGSFPASPIAIYERIAGALLAGLAALGVRAEAVREGGRGRAPSNCFGGAAPREIVVSGRKLVGSAQVRRRGVFLQHGSILLGFDAGRLGSVLPVAGRLASRPVSLRELTGGPITRGEVEEAVVLGFGRALGLEFEPSEETPAEAETAARLRAFKYLDALWTLEGRLRDRPWS